MLSIGHGEGFDVAGRLVDTLRRSGARGMPIVAGGAGAVGRTDVGARTGVDHVTQDLGEALAFCGCAPLVPVGAAVPAKISLRG
jgi:hypothetical protein